VQLRVHVLGYRDFTLVVVKIGVLEMRITPVVCLRDLLTWLHYCLGSWCQFCIQFILSEGCFWCGIHSVFLRWIVVRWFLHH